MKKFHIVKYVEGCTPKVKKFTTLKDMNKFVKDFYKIYDHNDDNWVDFYITNITGDFISIDGYYDL